jgi:hypothetical protein
MVDVLRNQHSATHHPGPSAGESPPWRVKGLGVRDEEGCWLVEPGKFVQIVGKGRSGKSRFTRSIGAAALAERPVLGRFPAVNPGPILVVAGQSDDPEYWAKLAEEHPGRVRILTDVFLDTSPGQARIEVEGARLMPRAIIVDTLRSASSEDFDENAAQDSAGVTEFLARLAKTHGTTVILIHHSRKNDRDDEDALDFVRGSTSLVNAADAVIKIRRHGMTYSSFVQPINKRGDATKDIKPFIVQHTDGESRFVEFYDPHARTERDLLGLVRDYEGSRLADLRREAGLTPSELKQETLERLVEQGLRIRRKFRYFTPEGLEQEKADAEGQQREADRVSTELSADSSLDDFIALVECIAKSPGPSSQIARALNCSESTVTRRREDFDQILSGIGSDPLLVARQRAGLSLSPFGQAVLPLWRAKVNESLASCRRMAELIGPDDEKHG